MAATAARQSSREATRRILASFGPSAAVVRNSRTHGELFLVGVSHVSKTSAALVQNVVIRDVHPDVVALELCKTRSESAILNNTKCETYKPWELFSIPGSFKQKLVTYVAANLYAALETKGLKPGAELKMAFDEAQTIGAKIALVDRDVNVTFERVGKYLSLKDAFIFLCDNKRIRIEHRDLLLSLKEARQGNLDPTKLLHVAWDVVELFRIYFPQLINALVDERNEHMVKEIREIEGTVVGVVGALHIPGMLKLWKEVESSESSGEESKS